MNHRTSIPGKTDAPRNANTQTRYDCLGVVFGDRTLEGCRASRRLFGAVRYARKTVSREGRTLAEAFEELLKQLDITTGSMPVAVAIPTEACYFATRPTAAGSHGASPRALLRESLRSSAARLDQMAIDVIHWQPDRRPVASIVAAPHDLVNEIRQVVTDSGHSLQRVEPAASCLISAAPEGANTERNQSLTTRVLLGEQILLAVVSRGRRPIQWQRLPLPAGDEATGIVSAIRSLDAAGFACGLDRQADTIVIHGRPELHPLIDQQWLSDNLPKGYRWVDSPSLRGADVAQSLADQFINHDDDGFDLIRQHRDPVALGRVVPYKEIAAYAAMAIFLSGWLWIRLDDVNNNRTALISTAPPTAIGVDNPQPQRDLLSSRASSVSRFLDKRVYWSEVLADVVNRLPDGSRLTNIRGSSPMLVKKTKKVKSVPTTLVLHGETVLDEGGNVPAALDDLANSIANMDSVRDHFQSVELNNVRRIQSQQTGVAGAEFSLVFTNPKAK